MTEKQVRKTYSKELECFYCSILMDEIRDRVRKLRLYGVTDSEIESTLHDDNMFPLMTVTKDYKIVLSGGKNTEIKMEPLVKAVYFLFLSHPEGIAFKYLPDYRKELADIYQKIKPFGLTERAIRSIEDVTNPLLNSINEKCSRIRAAFLAEIDATLLEQYIITGKSGEVKKITLPRKLVVWEQKSQFHKPCGG